MGFVSTFWEAIGFGIGIPIGLFVGFFLFVYSKPRRVQDPVVRPFQQIDSSALLELLPYIPLWVKNPDYERVDWLNKFILDMWPYLDKAICDTIRDTVKPIFAEYIGKYQIEAIEFQNLTFGNLPPIIHGVKVYETNERDLVIEPAIRWAGNPDIILALKMYSLCITVQLVDLQIFLAPRVTLKPLVPTFPCFANVVASLMEKPHVDFGMNMLGGDIMSIPGLYQFVQETIKRQVANLYIWPQTLEIPVLDSSAVSIKKPVGILHVTVIRALKLLKRDFLGKSDPYVKMSLTNENLPTKKTTVKMKTLNPEWNEKFKFLVKDPQSQVLQFHVYDWDKVGGHDSLGVQYVALNVLKPYETKELTLNLLKNSIISEPEDKKGRGQLVVELMFVPFKADSTKFSEIPDGYERMDSGTDYGSNNSPLNGAGLLSVVVHGAEDVEGQHHTNPYSVILFRGERRKTKVVKRTRDPSWNEEFEFMLEEPSFKEKICIDVMSKPSSISFRSKESLGHVEINLADAVCNGRINQKYHLINSKNGIIHVEIGWKTV